MPIPGEITPRVILEDAAINRTPVLDSETFMPMPGYVDWDTAEKAIKIVYKVFEPQVKGVAGVVSGENLSFEYFHDKDKETHCLAAGYHIKLDPFWVANRALRTIYIGADQGMCIIGNVLHELGHIKYSLLPDGQLWTEEEKTNEPVDRYNKAFSLAEEGRVESLICHKHKYSKIYISASLYSWAENRMQQDKEYSLGDMYPFLYGRLGDKNLLRDFRSLYIERGGQPNEMEKILSNYHKIKFFNTSGYNNQREKAKKLLLSLADWMDESGFKEDRKFVESHQSIYSERRKGDNSSHSESNQKSQPSTQNIKSLKNIDKQIAEIVEARKYVSDNPSHSVAPIEASFDEFNTLNSDEVIRNGGAGIGPNTGVNTFVLLEQIRKYYMKDINVAAPFAIKEKKLSYAQEVENIIANPPKSEKFVLIDNLRGQEEFSVRMQKVIEEAEYKISSLLADKLIIEERKKDGRFSIPSVMPSVMTTGGLNGKWYEQLHYAGKGHGDIEIVIGLDVSGSMSDHYGPMAVLCRILKKCFDSLNFSTSVLIWSSSAHQVYGKNDRVTADSEVPDISEYVGGGTDPNCCGVMASSIFDVSTRARRFYVIMTDGEWWDEDDTIDQMTYKDDFWSLLVYYSHEQIEDNPFRGYDQYVELDNMQQLGQAIVDFVEQGVSQTAASYV